MEVQTRAAGRVVVVEDNEIGAACAGLASNASAPDGKRRARLIGRRIFTWLGQQAENNTARIERRLRRTVNLDLAWTHGGSPARVNTTMDSRVVDVLLGLDRLT